MKRVLALLLSVVMTLTMVSCGKQEETETEVEPEEKMVYLPEYVVTGDMDDNCNYNNMILIGDTLYYVEYRWDSATNIFANTVNIYSLQDGSTKQIPIEAEENQYLYKMAVDNEQNMYLLLNVNSDELETADNLNSRTQFFLRKCDKEGNILFELELTDRFMEDGEQLWIQGMAVDGQGNLYFLADGSIFLSDANGADGGIITWDNGWINMLVTDRNGQVYGVCSDNHSVKGGTVLAEVDFTDKKIGTMYKDFRGGSLKCIAAGENNSFLVNDGTSVYQYDLKTQKYEKMFTWQDGNINGNYVDYMVAAEDGKVYATLNDVGNQECGIVKLNRMKASEVPLKEEIIFSTLEPNAGVEAAAVAFNNQSNKYHVTVKTYVDPYNWTENSYEDALVRFYNDISSGENCSDILDVSVLDEQTLIEKDIFEDLYPYIERSKVLDKEDFVEGILEAVEYDGKLYFMPKSFVLNSIVGKTSIVGEEMGWTLDEMKTFAEEHQDAFLFDALRKDEAMYYCMAFN